jgi:hypothetical protein
LIGRLSIVDLEGRRDAIPRTRTESEVRRLVDSLEPQPTAC